MVGLVREVARPTLFDTAVKPGRREGCTEDVGTVLTGRLCCWTAKFLAAMAAAAMAGGKRPFIMRFGVGMPVMPWVKPAAKLLKSGPLFGGGNFGLPVGWGGAFDWVLTPVKI